MHNQKLDWDAKGIDLTKVRAGKGFCPACHHSRKHKHDRSLSVDVEKGLFNCHNCNFSGTAMVHVAPDRPRKVYKRPALIEKAPSSQAVKWFASRGISEATLKTAGVTEGMHFVPQVNGERNCICFNYYRAGELVNVKYRDGAKNFSMAGGAELIFYNLNALEAHSGACIIVEGEMDALTILEAGTGIPVLSVPNGASKGSQKLEYLDNCWQEFEECTQIILFTDNDEAGLSLRDELARRLGKDRCMTVKYPDGCKDANEVLLKHGKQVLNELINAAQWIPLEGVELPEDHYADALAIMQNGYPSGASAGMGEFDDLLTFDPAGLTVITGIPGHGKSTFLNNLLINLAKRHNWTGALFSPEMKPYKYLTNVLVEIFAKKGLRAGMSLAEYDNAFKFVNAHFQYMKIDEMDVTIDGLLNKAKELVKRDGINFFVIDPWNFVEHRRPAGVTETEYISEALSKVKRFKDTHGCHVFIVAHPAKIYPEQGKTTYRLPKMYDIAGSAHWFNKTDNGIVVYKNLEKGATEIHVQKVRWFFLGREGYCNMVFDRQSKVFSPEQKEEPFAPPPNPQAGITQDYSKINGYQHATEDPEQEFWKD